MAITVRVVRVGVGTAAIHTATVVGAVVNVIIVGHTLGGLAVQTLQDIVHTLTLHPWPTQQRVVVIVVVKVCLVLLLLLLLLLVVVWLMVVVAVIVTNTIANHGVRLAI